MHANDPGLDVSLSDEPEAIPVQVASTPERTQAPPEPTPAAENITPCTTTPETLPEQPERHPAFHDDAQVPSTGATDQCPPRSSVRISPEKRGGRPRGPHLRVRGSPDVDDRASDVDPALRLRPEITCRRRGMGWEIALTLAEEHADEPCVATQGDVQLHDDQQGRWVLRDALGAVDLRHEDRGLVRAFKPDGIRLFKLDGQAERGRRVGSMGRGRFLVVAPADWRLDRENSPPEALAPEPVLDGRWMGHHFDRRDAAETVPMFEAPDGQRAPLSSDAGFELKGAHIDDGHPHAGLLFVGEVPQLGEPSSASYASVVVVEEGQGHKGWRTYAVKFADARPEIAARRSGWFSVRLYDESSDLIDSLSFRLASRLRGLQRIDEQSPLPGPGGHAAARLLVEHEDGGSLDLRANDGAARLIAARVATGTLVDLVADPQCDRTHWTWREQGGGPVDLYLHANRVWWTLGDESSSSSDPWTDRPLLFESYMLRATSACMLRVRLPCGPIAYNVDVGPERHRALRLRPGSEEGEVELPLRELGLFSEYEQHSADSQVRIWLGREDDRAVVEGVLAVVRASHGARAARPRALALQTLSPSRVMRMLARLRPHCVPSHRAAIDGLRRGAYRRLRRRSSSSERTEFARRALSLVAEILGAGTPHGDRAIPMRWVRRAELARRALAEPDMTRAAAPP